MVRVHLSPFPGGDAPVGNTRSHSEHVGKDTGGRWYYAGDGMEEQVAARISPFGGVAQVGERLPCKQEVRGSSPLISTFSDDPDSGIVPGRDGLKRPAAKRKRSRTAP